MKPLAELVELLMQQPDWTLEGYREERGCFMFCQVAGHPPFYCDTPQEAIHRALVAANVVTEGDSDAT